MFLKKKRIEISFLSSSSEVKIVFESINSLFFKCNSKDWSILLSKCFRDWATSSGPVVGLLKVQVLFGGFGDDINPSLLTKGKRFKA